MVTIEREDVVVDGGVEYRTHEPVRVRVTHRGDRYDLGDDGTAVRLAGRPDGWRDVAVGVVEQHALNINRRGVVFVPAHEGRDLDELTARVARASRAVYLALLDLDPT